MDNTRMNNRNLSGRRGCSSSRSVECSRSRMTMPDEKMIHWEISPLQWAIFRFSDSAKPSTFVKLIKWERFSLNCANRFAGKEADADVKLYV